MNFKLIALAALPAFLHGALALEPVEATATWVIKTDHAKMAREFDAWALVNNKEYHPEVAQVDMAEEYKIRSKVFSRNWMKVEGMAARGVNTTWVLGFDGPHMDLTRMEFEGLLGYEPKLKTESEATPFMYADMKAVEAGEAVDWVAKGAVTPVKNQGQCGSCWSFSTTGSIEGAHFLATGNLVSVSEQELVSCDHTDQGCGGGLMDNAFKWIMKNGGIDTEGDYGYTSGGGTAPACDVTKEAKKVVTIDSYQDVPQNDEVSLQKALMNQPVSVAVDATLWQFYSSGVFNGILGYCGTTLDHGVLVVGLDTTAAAGKGYYKVKNSWGPTWGEKGYIRLPVNRGKEGMCGIANSASVPIIKKA